MDALIMKRAEKYYAQYQRYKRGLVSKRRQAREHGNFYVPAAPRLAFVMRIRGVNQVRFVVLTWNLLFSW